jgi:hypothetical protein
VCRTSPASTRSCTILARFPTLTGLALRRWHWASYVLSIWFLEFVPPESRGSDGWLLVSLTLGTMLEALLAWVFIFLPSITPTLLLLPIYKYTPSFLRNLHGLTIIDVKARVSCDVSISSVSIFFMVYHALHFVLYACVLNAGCHAKTWIEMVTHCHSCRISSCLFSVAGYLNHQGTFA